MNKNESDLLIIANRSQSLEVEQLIDKISNNFKIITTSDIMKAANLWGSVKMKEVMITELQASKFYDKGRY